MDIDKVYRLAGGAMKRIWKLYVSKPFRDYNVENRAQKAISKDKPKAAQWHDATKAAVKETKKCKTCFICFCCLKINKLSINFRHWQRLPAVQQVWW